MNVSGTMPYGGVYRIQRKMYSDILAFASLCFLSGPAVSWYPNYYEFYHY